MKEARRCESRSRRTCIHKHTEKRRRCYSKQTLEPNSFHLASSTSASSNVRLKRRRKAKPRLTDRKWLFSSTDSSHLEDKFVVVSYNILGVANASKHPDLYFKVPPKCLEWNTRKNRILKEISHYNAGILCFQEVDRFKDLNGILHEDGFKGIYKGRTGEAVDGCAIFWNEKLFTLLHQEDIEFQSFGLLNNVAQLCVLKMKETRTSMKIPSRSRSILVGNIHVLFNPKRGDIKLGQLRLFLEKAYKLSQEWGGIPVIIAGDLNSIPQSAIYQFLASSELDIRLHDRREVSGQLEYESKYRNFRSQNPFSLTISRPLMWSREESKLATGKETATHARHQLRLCSAYHGIPGSSETRDLCGEPLATSYHSKFMGTVDYIWHTKELVPLRVVETLPVDVLRKGGGLPNKRWGSDHLALVCELAFADEGNAT